MDLKKTFHGNHEPTAGRPKNRWQHVTKDLKLLKIKNWAKCILNREDWRRTVDFQRMKL
jgi:hypothetical protein